MKLQETGIEGAVLPFPVLEHVMDDAGLIRGEQWDWERVHYDFKFENHHDGSVYYLRVPGVAVEGEIEKSSAKVKLLTPYLGKHYYPHGVEYDEEFPDHVLKTSKSHLSKLKELIDDYKSHEKE